MRIFEEFPEGAKTPCPICKTNKPGQCTLIPIASTQEGFNAQALPVHIDCLDLWYYKEKGLIAQGGI